MTFKYKLEVLYFLNINLASMKLPVSPVHLTTRQYLDHSEQRTTILQPSCLWHGLIHHYRGEQSLCPSQQKE